MEQDPSWNGTVPQPAEYSPNFMEPEISLPYSKQPATCVISGFHRDVDGNCALLWCYLTSRSNLLPTFRDNLSVPSSGVKNPPEDGTDRLSRNFGKKLPLLAEQHPRRARFLSIPSFVPIPSQISLVHALQTDLFTIYYNTILRSTSSSSK
jgi:hypothetical protein